MTGPWEQEPRTPTGRRLFTDNDPMDMLESDGVTWGDVVSIEEEARQVLPVDVQQRADAELGAAWRRCEAALPEMPDYVTPRGKWHMALAQVGDALWDAEAFQPVDGDWQAVHGDGPTPAAALDALTEALQARK